MERAIFFDRDGTLNDTTVEKNHAGHPQSFAPIHPDKLVIFSEVPKVLRELKQAGLLIIIVSNQPDIALGKIDEPTKDALKQRFQELMSEQTIPFDEVYYCNHHPDSINPNYPKECDCRKPKPGMILQAAKKWDIDLENSWMIGDTDRDVLAGQAAGCKTILLARPWSNQSNCQPDFVLDNLKEIVDIIH